MKLSFTLTMVIIMMTFVAALHAWNLNLLDSDVPTTMAPEQDTEILRVQVSGHAQVRAVNFALTNPNLIQLDFQDLRWVCEDLNWESDIVDPKTGSLSTIAWWGCSSEETLIFSLRGRIVSQEYGGVVVMSIPSVDYIWSAEEPTAEWPLTKVIEVSASVSSEFMTTPKSQVKLRNYPNPFNPTTTISFDLPQPGAAKLEIYNVRGELVRVLTEEMFASGEHQIAWDGKDKNNLPVSSGVYFCSLKYCNTNKINRMVLMK